MSFLWEERMGRVLFMQIASPFSEEEERPHVTDYFSGA